jgi:alkyldihydroxyacetonephosphate synthase
MRRMNQLRRLDSISQLATFGAGVAGPELEAQLRARGFTLGHFPQSFEYSTLGGWVATRSSGQQSLGYGRIEGLFAGGTLLAPAGETAPAAVSRLGRRPRLAPARPRLRGAAGYPDRRHGPCLAPAGTRGVPRRLFPQLHRRADGRPAIVQARCRCRCCASAHRRRRRRRWPWPATSGSSVCWRRCLVCAAWASEKCMLLCGFTGQPRPFARHGVQVLDLCHEHGRRQRRPPLRRAMDRGALPHTLSAQYACGNWATRSTRWRRPRRGTCAAPAGAKSRPLIRGAAGDGERVHVFTHLSHVYPQGASIYTTYLFRLAADPDATLARWAGAQGRGQPGHRRRRRDDQPPARRRPRPRALPGGRKRGVGLAALADAARRFDPGRTHESGSAFSDE